MAKSKRQPQKLETKSSGISNISIGGSRIFGWVVHMNINQWEGHGKLQAH